MNPHKIEPTNFLVSEAAGTVSSLTMTSIASVFFCNLQLHFFLFLYLHSIIHLHIVLLTVADNLHYFITFCLLYFFSVFESIPPQIFAICNIFHSEIGASTCDTIIQANAKKS